MASTRQEKLQMRQRGAASRKIKEVDFGFSLGLGPLGPESGEPSQPASQPTGVVAEPPRRRPSIFDIPLDEPREERRGSKRRRLESPSKDSRASGGQDSATIQLEPVDPDREQRRLSEQPLGTNGGNENGLLGQETPQLDDPVPSESANGRRRGSTPRDHDRPSSEDTEHQATTNGKRKRASGAHGRLSPESEVPRKAAATAVDIAKPSLPVAPQAVPMPESDETQAPQPKPGKRPRGRPSKSARTSLDESQGAEESHATSADAMSVEAVAGDSQKLSQQAEAPQETPVPDHGKAQISERQRGKRPRGRPSTSARVAPETNREAEEDHEASEGGSGRSRNNRKRKNSKDGELPTETSTAETSGQLDVQVNDRHAEPKDTAGGGDIPQPQKKQTAKKKLVRGGGRDREPLQRNQESQPEPEPQTEPESASPEPSAARKRRGKGRPSKSSAAAAQVEDGQTERQVDGEDTARPARKTRARGETVPVTVHRLANAASLTGVADSGDSSAEEESADELSTQRRTKLPNRGGVNPADVLSQVCRETLEKTLTTLRNGISNETNPTRRAEHVRKTKAVEAYGAELEGRLFDLSEILDSNFVLGVQAKKAKREMMDLRSRLYNIRKERQGVAMQTDAVRRTYAEENSARMSRSTINNTLHSLELAVDRRQNRAAADSDNDPQDSITAGLEFKLRTVAQRVSSNAPGAHDGLLNQIKTFNAQLEAVAEKLES